MGDGVSAGQLTRIVTSGQWQKTRRDKGGRTSIATTRDSRVCMRMGKQDKGAWLAAKRAVKGSREA